MFQTLSRYVTLAAVTLLTAGNLLGDQHMPSKTLSEKPPLVILLGAPGSGKGTQAAVITREFGIPHISTGDMLRNNIKNQTAIGLKAKTFMDAGTLVPDDIVIDMLAERLKQPDCQKGALLDGFPRTLAQAKALDLIAKDSFQPIVLSLEVSDATVIQRITGRRYCPTCNAIYHVTFSPPKKEGICDKCGAPLATRSDDVEKTVRERLAVFHQQIGPLKQYYAQKGILDEINGEQDSSLTAPACIQAIRARLEGRAQNVTK